MWRLMEGGRVGTGEFSVRKARFIFVFWRGDTPPRRYGFFVFVLYTCRFFARTAQQGLRSILCFERNTSTVQYFISATWRMCSNLYTPVQVLRYNMPPFLFYTSPESGRADDVDCLMIWRFNTFATLKTTPSFDLPITLVNVLHGSIG